MKDDFIKFKRILRNELREWGFANYLTFDPEPIIISNELIAKWESDLVQIINILRRVTEQEVESTINNNFSEYSIDTSFITRDNRIPIVARPDCILTNGSLKIIETNIDSSLGGMMQLSIFADFYKKYYSNKDLTFCSPLDGLIKILAESNKNKKVRTILFLLTDRFSTYDRNYCLRFCSLITESTGIECFVESLSSISYKSENDVNRIKESYDIIYRFDVIKGDSKIDKKLNEFLEICEKNNIILVSDPKDLRIEDKGGLAFLTKLSSIDSSLINEAEKKLIDEYVTKTVFLSDIVNKSLSENLMYEFNDFANNKDKFVLKRIYSYGGQHVVCGRYQDFRTWKERVKSALLESDLWVVQLYLESDDINIYIDNNNDSQLGNDFVISPFIFGKGIYNFAVRVFLNGTHNGVAGLKSGSDMGFIMVAKR